MYKQVETDKTAHTAGGEFTPLATLAEALR